MIHLIYSVSGYFVLKLQYYNYCRFKAILHFLPESAKMVANDDIRINWNLRETDYEYKQLVSPRPIDVNWREFDTRDAFAN